MKKLFIIIAIALIFSTLSQAQKSAEDYAKEGAEKYENGNYESAIRNFTKAIKLEPDYLYKYKSYFGRGLAYFELGQFKKAKIDFTRAIREYPNSAELYFWRAYTRYKLGNSAGGEIADYNRAILLKPTYARAFFNRAWSKWDLGKKEAACLDWEEAFNLGFTEAKKQLEEHCGF